MSHLTHRCGTNSNGFNEIGFHASCAILHRSICKSVLLVNYSTRFSGCSQYSTVYQSNKETKRARERKGKGREVFPVFFISCKRIKPRTIKLFWINHTQQNALNVKWVISRPLVSLKYIAKIMTGFSNRFSWTSFAYPMVKLILYLVQSGAQTDCSSVFCHQWYKNYTLQL